jgi:hypothetical protein
LPACLFVSRRSSDLRVMLANRCMRLTQHSLGIETGLSGLESGLLSEQFAKGAVSSVARDQ